MVLGVGKRAPPLPPKKRQLRWVAQSLYYVPYKMAAFSGKNPAAQRVCAGGQGTDW